MEELTEAEWAEFKAQFARRLAACNDVEEFHVIAHQLWDACPLPEFKPLIDQVHQEIATIKGKHLDMRRN